MAKKPLSERQLKKKIDQLVKMMMQTGLASAVRNETNNYTDPLFHISLYPKLKNIKNKYRFGLQIDTQKKHTALIHCLADEDIITSKTFVQWLKDRETNISSIENNNPKTPLIILNLGSPMSEETELNKTDTVDKDRALQKFDEDCTRMTTLVKFIYDTTTKLNKHQAPSQDEWNDFIDKLAALEHEAKLFESGARKCNQTRLISEAVRRFCLIINFLFNFEFLNKKISDRFDAANHLKDLSEKHAEASNAIRFFQKRLDLKNIAKHNSPSFK